MQLIKDADVLNKRVLVRADFNVAMDEKGNIIDDFRIRATLPTIKYLIEKEAKVVLMSHLGKPKGAADESLRLKPIGERLQEYINAPIYQANNCTGEEVVQKSEQIKSGEILLLENLRFYKGEEENDDNFAKELAKLGDIYVNDAFGVSHRAHASVVAIAKYLPAYAGLLLEKEIDVLSRAKESPEHPLVVIIGGAKISTKIKVIKNFLGIADHILLGGALANTVLHAKGIAIGQSLIEEEMIEEVKNLQITDTKLHLPVDTIVSIDRTGKGEVRIEPVGKIGQDELILDIGPETEKLFTSVIKEAKMVIWNGPMGLFEVEKFAHGTKAVAQAVAECECQSTIGGGETISFLDKAGLTEKMSHISTGGGAMLKFLAGEEMPGLNALERSE